MIKLIKFVLGQLYSFWVWAYVVFAMTGHAAICFILTKFAKNKISFSLRTARLFIRLGYVVCGFKVTIKGQENIPKTGSFIILSNHQSHLDIVAYMSGIPRDFSFVAKKELLKVPILGWDIKTQGHILIDRANFRNALKQLEIIVEQIKKGKSVLFFPEGTRSFDGQIGVFKRGAFQAAVKAGVPVVPCYVSGTVNILNKKGLTIKPGKIDLTIGKMLPVRQTDDKSEMKKQVDNLMNMARKAILEMQKQEEG
jgi:1-acyl-sn-glycerol-3-phosphate acyltransferase